MRLWLVQAGDGVERRWAQIEAVAAALFGAEILSGPDVGRVCTEAHERYSTWLAERRGQRQMAAPG